MKTTVRIATLISACILAANSAHASLAPPLSPSGTIEACRRMFHSDRRLMTRVETQRRWQLEALSPGVLRSRLESLISRAPAGSDAFVSMAYVLARRGIDVEKNVARMLIPLRQPQWVARHDLAFPQFAIMRAGDVYQRHPLRGVIHLLLSAQADAPGEALAAHACADLFRAHPSTVLRQAGVSRADLAALAGSLAAAGDDSLPLLQQMSRHRDPRVRAAASYCLPTLGLPAPKWMSPAPRRALRPGATTPPAESSLPLPD